MTVPHFPEHFLWGTATSSHQVEGGNTLNDWWQWEQTPGHIADGSVSGDACDQYRRFTDDFTLAASLGQNAHRLSLEWSRIEPRPGEWDMDEVMHYRTVLRALKDRGMKTVVTLWHFTLPQWFAESGGWEQPDSVTLFCRYGAFVTAELKDLVDVWITINEPNVYAAQSYRLGVWPPGVKSARRMNCVFSRMATAHRTLYRQMHAIVDRGGQKAVVGAASNWATFEPYRTSSLLDRFVARCASLLYNRLWYIRTKHAHDYIGINYYFHHRVSFSLTNGYRIHVADEPQSDIGWVVRPEKLGQAVREVSRYRLPIYVTEHGIADAGDALRPEFLKKSIQALHDALCNGADVRGYFHWSLIDNFEWEKGFEPKFGLIAVDRQTQRRIPRPSAEVYAEICKQNRTSGIV